MTRWSAITRTRRSCSANLRTRGYPKRVVPDYRTSLIDSYWFYVTQLCSCSIETVPSGIGWVERVEVASTRSAMSVQRIDASSHSRARCAH
jgi:hypothetical protein